MVSNLLKSSKSDAVILFDFNRDLALFETNRSEFKTFLSEHLNNNNSASEISTRINSILLEKDFSPIEKEYKGGKILFVNPKTKKIISDYEIEILEEVINEHSSEIKIKEIISSLNSVIYSFSVKENKIIYVSDNAHKILSINNTELKQKPVLFLRRVKREFFPGYRTFLNKLLQGEKSVYEFEYESQEGIIHYLRQYAVPIVINEKVEKINGFICDISEERKKLLELTRSEERFRTLFETANDLIFVLDQQGKFILINLNGALSLEFLPEEMIERHLFEFVNDENKSSVAKKFQQIVNSDSIISFEAIFNTKYGKKMVFEINAKASFENEMVTGVVGFGRDITSRKADQEKMRELNNKLIEANRLVAIERDRAKKQISVLEELNNLKNQFVSNISHELRTPLASIIGFSETIDSDSGIPEEIKKDFNKIILTEAKRLSALINDVLDISKLEDGKIILELIEFDVIKLLNELCYNYKNKTSAKNIEFTFEIPSGEIKMLGDQKRIEQAFDNLLDNALKFTNEGGRISLIVQNLFKEIEIIISDTGIGIPKKDLPFLFEKFYRVHRKGLEIPGTGLGLSLVRKIIELHKGLVTIHSEENQGTTVVITLPRE